MSKFENPYAPPKSDRPPPPQGGAREGLVDASTDVRFANLFLDTIFRFVFAFVVGGAMRAVGVTVHTMSVAAYLIGFVTVFVYYVALEGIFGWTLGKRITGTRVVALDGSRASFGAIVGRTLTRFVPFDVLSFFGGGPGWHDRWSGTRVVRARS